MDIRFHLGWDSKITFLDEEASKRYVEEPDDGTFYTRVDIQCTTQSNIERLCNYERNLYFIPFNKEIIVKEWVEDLGILGKNHHSRSFVVNKVVHGVMLS